MSDTPDDRADDRQVSWLGLPCVHAARLISESHERPLTRKERVSLGLHLALCKWCRRFRRQTRFINSLIRSFAASEAPPTASPLPSDARRRIESALRGESH
jgi:hypothetical protein